MFIAILTLLSALSISGVAIFYSVIGLASIFPGAFWPVVIMGSVLEVGKLITASWLYRNWKHTRWLLKTYLTTAVVVLSLITSMGIFGFLSKAHLEQNLTSDTVTQRIEVINSKIASENNYIDRQTKIIERAETSLNRTTTDNSDAIDIELKTLEKAEDKFKTLLTVETNTIKELNARMKILDKDVSDILKTNKSFFNEEKAAKELKDSQKEERALINKEISNANSRIEILKSDFTKESATIQSRIDKLREGSSDNKTGANAQIQEAEANILKAQNNIDALILEREPLESKMIKLEAEVGPVKYIASLVVDWGITNEVDTSEAVRWVILIIICVFDPLAVLLLVAANQSLIRRFPVEPPPPPQEIVDLEKPDHDLTFDPPKKTESPEEKAWNSMINEATLAAQKEQFAKATERLEDWNKKLEEFNKKVPKPEEKPIKIVTDESKKKEFEERIAAEAQALEEYARKAREEVDNLKDGFDPAEVEGYEEFNSKYDEKKEPYFKKEKEIVIEAPKPIEESPEPNVSAILPEHKEPKVLDQFKPKKEKEPRSVISVDTEPERIKPDLTEVIEPEEEQPVSRPTFPTDEEREQQLKEFHAKNGNFEDISDEELKKERDESNKAQFLADVSLTEEEAQNHPPITASRLAFFQDHIDDILRGNTTFEQLPPDIAKTCAVLMDDRYENPDIITKGSALKEEPTGLPQMTTEQLKEQFAPEPETEDRDMSEEELDKLLDGFDQPDPEEAGKKYEIKIVNGEKVRVPVEDNYIQNEEQNEDTLWQKTKELDLPEPEKNEILIPELENTEEDAIEDRTDEELIDIQPQSTISPDKINRHKKRMIEEADYQAKIEARIDNLISKIESKEITLDDLTDADRQVIIDIMRQNG